MSKKYITLQQARLLRSLRGKNIQVITKAGVILKTRNQLLKSCESLWRKAIKAKWGDRCLAVGQVRACSGNIDCSHIIPKSRGLIARFHPENGFPLCHGHHFEVWHKDPIWAYGLTVTLIGEEKLKELKKECNESGAGMDLRMTEIALKEFAKSVKTIDQLLSE